MEQECQANDPRNEGYSKEQRQWKELPEEDTRVGISPNDRGEQSTSGLLERRVNGTLYLESETTALRRKED